MKVRVQKPKFKGSIFVLGKSVVMYISYMDERFRNKNGGWGIPPTFQALNGIKIYSNAYPALIRDEVLLPGSLPHHDHMVAHITLGSNAEAKRYKKRIIEALKDWAMYWPGFDEEKKEEIDEEEYNIPEIKI